MYAVIATKRKISILFTIFVIFIGTWVCPLFTIEYINFSLFFNVYLNLLEILRMIIEIR